MSKPKGLIEIDSPNAVIALAQNFEDNPFRSLAIRCHPRALRYLVHATIQKDRHTVLYSGRRQGESVWQLLKTGDPRIGTLRKFADAAGIPI